LGAPLTQVRRRADPQCEFHHVDSVAPDCGRYYNASTPLNRDPRHPTVMRSGANNPGRNRFCGSSNDTEARSREENVVGLAKAEEHTPGSLTENGADGHPSAVRLDLSPPAA
jgi:hypothetical protein